MDISVVIPLYNEAESLPELFAWIERVMKEHNFSYEVIFINDGSTDNSWEVIEALKSKNPEVVHAVKFRRNYGKSPGLNCGFQRAKGDVVKNHSDQAVQRYGTQIFRYYEPARFQLRAEGLQEHRNQEHRSL